MSQQKINQLLDRYYQGETSLEEEDLLRNEIQRGEDIFQDEMDIFEYFKQEASTPENFEEQIFGNIQQKNKHPRITSMGWFRYTSIAAAACLIASIFWVTINNKTGNKLSEEQQFAILEQALLGVSYGVQPAQDDDLLVLFQDENLEIVMN